MVHCILCLNKWVVVWKVNFAVEEIGGAEESLIDVVKHVSYFLVDASLVRLAEDPLTILGRVWAL